LRIVREADGDTSTAEDENPIGESVGCSSYYREHSPPPPSPPADKTVSLNGEWRVADSVAAEPLPADISHRGPVPGLANLATPAFVEVDEFDGRGLIDASSRERQLPESTRVRAAGGSRLERDYIWYRRAFQVGAKHHWAILRVNKAQWGTAVWHNGRKMSEHFGCFTAGLFERLWGYKEEADGVLGVEAMLEGVEGRDGFAGFGFGSAGFGAVDAGLFGSGE
jgi:hypothetical protein